jgi:5-methylcytosine-specific restriction endonuclease McrA
MAKHYKCAKCLGAFPSKDVQVDHIEPIIDPNIGFVDWNSVIEAMFCEKDNLQCLCKPCHKIKTDAEKALAKERKNERKPK